MKRLLIFLLFPLLAQAEPPSTSLTPLGYDANGNVTSDVPLVLDTITVNRTPHGNAGLGEDFSFKLACHEATLSAALTVTFSDLPAAGTRRGTEIIFTQNATGGFSVTWPASVPAPTPAINLTANTITRVYCETVDGGTIISCDSNGIGDASARILTLTAETETYDATGWNGDTTVPTKDLVRDILVLLAPLASPTFTGTPLAPTAAVDTNTTQLATTGFVLAQAGSATPIVASTGAVGASTRYARQDHVHPAQTSVTGNAGTATALAAGRTIAVTGDLAYTSASFDGTGNVTGTGTLATVNSNTGSFGSSTSIPTVTVNGKGLITAASGNAVVAPAGTLTGTTLASGVTASSLTSFGNSPIINYAPTSLSDDTYAGTTFTGYINTGGVTQWNLVAMNSGGSIIKAHASSAIPPVFPAIGIAVATASNSAATTVLVQGVFRDDGGTAWTPGQTIYMNTSYGGLTQTAPSGTGDIIQAVGVALSAHVVLVKISPDVGVSP